MKASIAKQKIRKVLSLLQKAESIMDEFDEQTLNAIDHYSTTEYLPSNMIGYVEFDFAQLLKNEKLWNKLKELEDETNKR